MKIKLLKTYNSTIAAFLAILGFSACLNSGCAKYGSPTAEYIVNGKVSCKETHQPIENIQVSARYSYAITFTDVEGNYRISDWGDLDGHTSRIKFRDTTDEYRDLDAVLEFRKGEKEKIFNVTLTPNNSQNHENQD